MSKSTVDLWGLAVIRFEFVEQYLEHFGLGLSLFAFHCWFDLMSANQTNAATPQDTRAQFEQTHWSVVLAAAHQDLPGAPEALEKLCRVYWYPLYAFLRRDGQRPEDAKDLVQGFLAQL